MESVPAADGRRKTPPSGGKGEDMSVNGSIIIRDYEVTACHGVNPEEKTKAQRFVVSAVLDCDVARAAESDDIAQTVSYAHVCKLIKAFLCEESKNLLECLAMSIARRIMLAYPAFTRAEVTVDKPDAPMKGVFRSVAVRAVVKRTTAYIGMGSSMGDRDAYMDKALGILRAHPLVLSVRESHRIHTAPYGGAAENEFLNSAVEVVTLLDADGLFALMHHAEEECARERKVHWGDRTLDLDLLLFGNEVRGEGELILPHPEMSKRDFVLAPLAEIAPHAVHPLARKRISELLADLYTCKHSK